MRTLRERDSYKIGSALTNSSHILSSSRKKEFKRTRRGYARAGFAVETSNRAFAHLSGDVIRLANGEGDDGKRRVLRAAGGELATVGNEQVLDVMRLPELVAHAIGGIAAHAASAEVVCGRVGRRAE